MSTEGIMKCNEETKNKKTEMLRRNGPVMKSMESVPKSSMVRARLGLGLGLVDFWSGGPQSDIWLAKTSSTYPESFSSRTTRGRKPRWNRLTQLYLEISR